MRQGAPREDVPAGPPEALEGRERGRAAPRLDVLRDDLVGGDGGEGTRDAEHDQQRGNESDSVSHGGCTHVGLRRFSCTRFDRIG